MGRSTALLTLAVSVPVPVQLGCDSPCCGRLHPSARQTQLNFTNIDPKQYPMVFSGEPPVVMPRARGGLTGATLLDPVQGTVALEESTRLQGYDVLLKAGDVLFLPPYWYHYVRAEDVRYHCFPTAALRTPQRLSSFWCWQCESFSLG